MKPYYNYEVIFGIHESHEGMIFTSSVDDVVKRVREKNKGEAKEKAIRKYSKFWEEKRLCGVLKKREVVGISETSNWVRWVKLWNRIRAKGNPRKVYYKLVRLYFEPYGVYHRVGNTFLWFKQVRYYHNLDHIIHCLQELDPVRHLLDNPNEVEFAIWFHDVIYDTRAEDNEERSAQMAYDIAKEVGLSESFGQNVVNLILATRYKTVPDDKDTEFLLDIDLSILGRPTEEFDEYERRVRMEYNWVPEKEFKVGRAGMLIRLLNLPYIYSTDFFRQKYEAQARRNLERSLGILTIN